LILDALDVSYCPGHAGQGLPDRVSPAECQSTPVAKRGQRGALAVRKREDIDVEAKQT